nr:ATP-dependent DNA helicase PIF1 [Tanacetum cinerariifolium]
MRNEPTSQLNTNVLNYQPIYTPPTYKSLSSSPIMPIGGPYNSHVDSNINYATPSKAGNTPSTIHLQRSTLSSITSNHNVTKLPSVNQPLAQKQHAILGAVSGNIAVTKRGRGRPRKNPGDTSILPKKTKHMHDNENQNPAITNSQLATPSTVTKQVANIPLQRSPLSDITSTPLSRLNQNCAIQELRRGRPPKSPMTVDISSQIADVESSHTVTEKPRKPSGRPRKLPQPNADESLQNTHVSMGVGSSTTNLYTPYATNVLLQIDNTFTKKTSKTNPRTSFKNQSPVPFNIGSPPIIQTNSTTKGTTNAKGKSISIIPDFEPTDEENEDGNVYIDPDIPDFDPCGDDIEDDYGYLDRIQGISKDYYDHGDPTEQCNKCGALLWLAESNVGSNTAAKSDGFSLCCGRGKVKLPVALKNPPPLLMGLFERRTPKKPVIYG